jgi:hypothetical protein
MVPYCRPSFFFLLFLFFFFLSFFFLFFLSFILFFLAFQVTSQEGTEQEYSLCTLTPGVSDQCQLALSFHGAFTLKLLQGQGPVSVCGNVQFMDDDDDDDDMMDDDMDDDGEDDGEDDDEEDDGEEDDEEEDGKQLALPPPRGTKRAAEDEAGGSKKKARSAELMEQTKQAMSAYKGSEQEKKDLIKNYNKCGGDWPTVLRYQIGSDEGDLPRLQAIIKAAKIKPFTAAQRKAILEELHDNEPEEIDLEEPSDGEDDEEDDDDDMNEDSMVANERGGKKGKQKEDGCWHGGEG